VPHSPSRRPASAIQFARWCGAHVSTTASARHRELLRALGAERVIDYRADRFDDLLRDMDVVSDSFGG
jgi:NADPH:quinone reductase-like Zn-dependent oxidoreductase